jgi:DNA-binding NtrC family response regulator
MEDLLLYRWPGNVRQLMNQIRRLVALAENGAVLMPEHLPAEIAATRRTVPASERTLEPTEIVVRIDQPLPAAFEHVERVMVPYALTACGNRLEAAAKMLGVSRKGLYLKRHRLGLDAGGDTGDDAGENAADAGRENA